MTRPQPGFSAQLALGTAPGGGGREQGGRARLLQRRASAATWGNAGPGLKTSACGHPTVRFRTPPCRCSMGHIESRPSHAPTCPPSSSSKTTPTWRRPRAWPCASSLRWRCARRRGATRCPRRGRTRCAAARHELRARRQRRRGGLALLHEVLARRDAPAVIVMTAYAEVELAVQALKAGAVDFITKPWRNERLEACVRRRWRGGRRRLRWRDELLGESSVMRSLRCAQIAQVGASEASVLILGENGVGKELVAARCTAPRRAPQAHCWRWTWAAARGAGGERALWPPARQLHRCARVAPGRFVAAAGGTLCSTRSATCRWPNNAAGRAGAPRGDAAGQRQAAARRCARAGRHQPARGRAVRCQAPGPTCSTASTPWCCVPPLRERGAGDVALLLRHYHSRTSRVASPRARSSLRSLARLTAYRWPGNVRELRQACERATLLANKPVLTWDDSALTDLCCTHACRARPGPEPP